MRVLATIGFSFSAGVFLAALLPWNGWQLYAAGGVLLLALAWLFAARKQKYFRRGLLLLLPLLLGIDGIWLAVTAAELAALAVSAAMLLTKDKVFHYRKV